MKTSLRRNLLKWLIGPLVLCNLVGAALIFWVAWTPTQTAWDQSLADTAWALLPRLKQVEGRISIDLPQQAEQVLRVDHFDAIYFSVRDGHGRLLAGDLDLVSAAGPAVPYEPVVGNGTMRGEPVRTIFLVVPVGNELAHIVVAETLRKRDRSLRIILLALLVVEMLLTTLAVSIVWAAVGRAMRPLHAMQRDLNARQPLELAPVSDRDTPAELVPLVDAINALLLRSMHGASAQRDFLANMAHQLRTPIAGLKINFEWLKHRFAIGETADAVVACPPEDISVLRHDPEVINATNLMTLSIQRMARQTNQLLALARAEPTHFDERRLEILRLDTLIGEAMHHFIQQADLKQIDLGFELDPVQVLGDRFLLHDLLDNLIDNAIRYTPDQGTVTVRCRRLDEGSRLVIEDDGPGIDPLHRDLVFTRFYRLSDVTSGSGLGLSIVREIVRDHKASAHIGAGQHGKGTLFTVQFPPVQVPTI